MHAFLRGAAARLSMGIIMGIIVTAALARPASALPLCRVQPADEGGPAILIDGQPQSPILFMGNNQFGRDEVIAREIRMAGEAGVRIFSCNLWLDWHGGEAKNAEALERFFAANPDGYLYFRIWVGPSPDWARAHPEHCLTQADGTRRDWATPSSEAWREDAGEQLKRVIRRIADGPHGDRLIGVCPLYLETGEWFYPDTNAFWDYSPANVAAFRRWLRGEYRNERGLRAAWGEPDVTFDDAAIPSPEARQAAAFGPFRGPAQQAAIDLTRFQSEAVADAIAHFARCIKEASDGRLLAGAFYGYSIELNGNGPRALGHSGHLAFSRLLDCPDIDIIHAPYSYFQRKVGQPAHLHLPADSIALHGKLGIFEDDTYTHLAMPPGPGVSAPGWPDRTEDMAQTLAVNRRNFGRFFSHGCGMWIFDLLSDGRWDSKDYWDTVPLLRRIAALHRGYPTPPAEIAFVVSEASLPHLVADTHPETYHALYAWRAEVSRIGAPVAYVLQRDLPRLSDAVRMVILANPYVLSSDEQRALDKLLARGGTVVWTMAPGIIRPDGPDPARIAETCGIEVARREDDTPMRFDIVPTSESFELDPAPWRARFVVTDPDVDVLARYSETGEVYCAAKPVRGGVSVYTAGPRLSRDLLRWMAERSGIRPLLDGPGVCYPVGPYLIVHTETEGTFSFRLPEPAAVVERIVPYQTDAIARNTATWSEPLPGETTVLYRINHGERAVSE